MRLSTTKNNREEIPPLKSLDHKFSHENIPNLENQLRNSRSLITITPLNKSTDDLQINENNHSIKSQRKTDIHVIKLPKNKISSSYNTSQLSHHQATNIVQVSNTNKNKPISHMNSLNIKSDTYGRKRTSSLGGVTVRRVKTMDNTNNRLSRLLVKKE